MVIVGVVGLSQAQGQQGAGPGAGPAVNLLDEGGA